MSSLPEIIASEDQLNEVMTRPSPALIEFAAHLRSPLVILGAGGKMGPTLAVRARRAVEAAGKEVDVIAVSRFSAPTVRAWLDDHGVRTISADLFDETVVERLPDAENILYLVGLKFGTQQTPSLTWAANTLIPAYVMQRYPGARVVALSSGNVYPLVPVSSNGSQESDPLTPRGEYANSCVGRERIFEYFARRDSSPLVLIRLSYAVDLRYGVLVDIARKVYDGQPVDVTMGYLPYIWQGDANDLIIRSLALVDVPSVALNLTGARPLKVRDVARQFGEMMGREVRIIGTEADTAFLSDTTRLRETLRDSQVPLAVLMRWTAHWVMRDMPSWDKPTHFEVRDGTY